jgi:hypothetical protein
LSVTSDHYRVAGSLLSVFGGRICARITQFDRFLAF